MGRKRHTPEQIITALREDRPGTHCGCIRHYRRPSPRIFLPRRQREILHIARIPT